LDKGTELSEEMKQKAETAKYTIVLASYVSQKNAEAFIHSLAEKGFDKTTYIKRDKVSRVLYSGYPTKAEAYQALNTLRQQDPVFSNAWILEL